MTFYPPDETKLNGVLQKGTRSLFTLTSTPPVGSNYAVSNILNTQQTYYHSQYSDYANICVSFESFFLIRSYSIMTRYNNNDHFPKKWKVEGSLNKKLWHEIDERDTKVLFGVSYKENFPVKHIGSYKHIKITLIETSEEKATPFTIGALDFFGRITNKGFAFNESNKRRNKIRGDILSIIIFTVSS